MAGNVPAKYTSKNALDIADYIGIDARIAPGAVKPLIASPKLATHAHGEIGLRCLTLPDAKRSFDDDHVWDVIYQEALKSKGELCLITLGPLTNIAIALFKYPDLKDYLKEIVIMGGSMTEGNVSAYAEFNIFAGRCSCQFVIEANGGIYPCDFYVTDEWHMGNIKDSTFEELESSETAKIFVQSSEYIDPKCKSCKWINLCRGGCRRNRESMINGRPNLNYFCSSYREFFEYAIERLYEIAHLVANLPQDR